MLSGVPRPLADLDTAPFWDGCRDERFLLPTCARCGRARWPPGPMCPHCQATATEWRETAGGGSVYSWVVAAHPVDEGLADQVPYVVALIGLPEGVKVVGNVLGCAPETIAAGDRVELIFERDAKGRRLPNFRRVEQSN